MPDGSLSVNIVVTNKTATTTNILSIDKIEQIRKENTTFFYMNNRSLDCKNKKTHERIRCAFVKIVYRLLIEATGETKRFNGDLAQKST